MANQIIKQPDGRFAVWSTIVDAFTMIDATPEEIIESWAEEERERIANSVRKTIDGLNDGRRPYYQFTMSWQDACRRYEDKHGKRLSLEELRNEESSGKS